jgi:hypothetical protein
LNGKEAISIGDVLLSRGLERLVGVSVEFLVLRLVVQRWIAVNRTLSISSVRLKKTL